MKIYAIGYQEINNKLKYFIYDCKFLSSTREVDEDFYDELKSVFNIAGKNNNYLSGIYFDTI